MAVTHGQGIPNLLPFFIAMIVAKHKKTKNNSVQTKIIKDDADFFQN